MAARANFQQVAVSREDDMHVPQHRPFSDAQDVSVSFYLDNDRRINLR